MTDSRLLEICNVTAFNGATQVFTDLNLSLNHSENVAILGPNGAGKSTLLKLLTRDIYPVVKQGSYVKINGSETVNVNELRKEIGLVSHDLQLRHVMPATGLDVVLSGFFGAVGMIYSHYDITDWHIQKASQAINALGLSALAKRPYTDLSTGQQRRFLLARAMIHNPKTLIFDEPTSNLDIHACFAFIQHMRAMAQQGAGILLATHHIQEIIPEINRVVLLREGKVVMDGSKVEMLTSKILSELYETKVDIVERNGFYQVFPG